MWFRFIVLCIGYSIQNTLQQKTDKQIVTRILSLLVRFDFPETNKKFHEKKNLSSFTHNRLIFLQGTKKKKIVDFYF